MTPVLEICQQLLAHAAFDAEQDPGQQRMTRRLEDPRRDQLEQGRLAHLHGEGGLTTQAIATGQEP